MAYTYEELRKKISQSKKDFAEIEKYLKEGETLEKDIEKNAYQVEARLKGIEGKLSQLKELAELQENLKNIKIFLDEKKSLLEQPKVRLKNYFGAELDRKFKEKGWSLSGKIPELKVGALLLEFLLSKDMVKIWYGPKTDLLGRANLTTDETADTVTKIQQEIDEASFKDEEPYLKLLFEAYKGIIKRAELDFGTNVPINQWLGEIAWHKQGPKFLSNPTKDHFKGYSRTQLSYDLSRLKQHQFEAHQMRLVIASREQTKKKEDSLWIPNSSRGEGTHYSAVSFRKIST